MSDLMLVELLSHFIQLFVLSAPWLLLGLLIAGIIHEFLPKQFLQKHLAKEGVGTTLKAALIGAPMPLCSCGVIPAAIGLRRAGASKSATTAFLVSTPETGVDSVSVSYALLGPFMAIIRPIAAVFSAVIAGLLVGRDTREPPASEVGNNNEQSCCHESQRSEIKNDNKSCCHSDKKPEPAIHGVAQKMLRALNYSITTLLRDTSKWLLIGLVFAAMVQTYIPAEYMSQWGSGLLAMLVVILISIPMYICATASTPIAAGLLFSGVSPGAVLVFMLAGPATNVATLGVVYRELGKRAIFAYLIGVIGTALVFGWLTDYLVSRFSWLVEVSQPSHQHEMTGLLGWLSAGILLALLIRLILREINRSACSTINTH